MENATDSKKDSSDNKELNKPKKRGTPKEFGALAIVSEQEGKPRRGSPEKPVASGHVGKAALLAETKPARNTKSAAETTGSAAGKHVETVGRAELLTLSEKVVIDGSTLRQIYETHLVGEQGLRRLIAEYLRDGDLKKALRREIVERQIDFERDPSVRDLTIPAQLSTGANSSNDDTGKAVLAKLLKQTNLAIENENEETAFFKARALYEANQLQQHKRQRRAVDISVAVLILMLLVLIIALYMGRS